MTRPALEITIPDDLKFSDLGLSRDPQTGELEFNWDPIERICRASAIDISVFRDQHEANICALIVEWYARHLAHGGARDPVQDELIAEMLAENERGGGFTHEPGRA